MQRKLPILAAVIVLCGCRVWTDFGAPDQPNGEPCGFLCDPAPWWNDAWDSRIGVRGSAAFEGDNVVVLPIVLDATLLPSEETRPEDDDVRVVLGDTELPREVERLDDGTAVIWARFPRAPQPDEALYVYWGNPDATVPESPWDDHIGAFHFEGDFETSVPGLDRIQTINDPSIADDGRLGKSASVPSWPGSLRLYDAQVLHQGTMSFEFSFRGRMPLEGESGRSVMRVPPGDQGCSPVDVSRTPTGETTLTWIDAATCIGEDDVEHVATVPVNITDGAWHEIVASVDQNRGVIVLIVDGEAAEATIEGGDSVTSRVDIRGGVSEDPPGQFLFDELRFSTLVRTADEGRFVNAAVRGDAFELGTPERQ